ncbi:MAG: hypothetical protein F4170_02455 [Rhodobacteraceae bacterium]|nr:hypothetical protein [Paracoccaceae bacterium]
MMVIFKRLNNWITNSGYQDTGLKHQEKGLTLFEASLSLALFGMFISLVNIMVSSNDQRQKAISLGKETAFITRSVQKYVGFEYDRLRDDLVASSSNQLLMSIGMDTINEAGYLPHAVLEGGTFRNSFGNRFTLFLRGVNGNDVTSPQATLSIADVDPDNDGRVEEHLLDGVIANGEYELEAILVSSEGKEVEPHMGSPAVVASKLFSAGYVQDKNTARGPYGVWEMDISSYRDLTHYPGEKQFVSLIALSGNGVFGYPDTDDDKEVETNTYLDRCINTLGSVRAVCESNNELFTEVVFNSFDRDGDGFNDSFGSIRNLYQLEMGSPVDSDGDNIPDIFSVINNLHGIGCRSNNPNTTTDELTLDCPEVKLTGDAKIERDLIVGNQLTVEGDTRSQRFLAGALNDQDLTKGIYHAELIRMDGDTTIAKPACLDTGSEPQIFVTPAAFAIGSGHSLVGIRGLASEEINSWEVGLKAIISHDGDEDGKSDVIDLVSASDYVQVLTKCS